MSKITNALNQIWHEQEGETIKFGFTRNFLDTLDECWHILPAGHTSIKAKAPLLTVETNDSLVSILAPIGGNFLQWNETATNFPDKLTENDVIMTLTSAKVDRPTATVTENPLRNPFDQLIAAADQQARARRNQMPPAVPRNADVVGNGQTRVQANRTINTQWAAVDMPVTRQFDGDFGTL